MSKEAMKLALEALKRMKRYGNTFGYRSNEQNPYEQVCEAIEALEALAQQPAQQEPIDQLIHAWQALEETSDRVPDEGNVEGRMHMSVIRSAWKQMDSLVRDLWDERGRP